MRIRIIMRRGIPPMHLCIKKKKRRKLVVKYKGDRGVFVHDLHAGRRAD